jgi:hypothetical protein
VLFKTCKHCNETRALEDFYVDRAARDGRRTECKACTSARRRKWYEANRQFEIDRVTEWRKANPEHFSDWQRTYRNRPERKRAMRDLYYRRTYGLTADEIDAMLAAQDGGCAICGRLPTRLASLHLDHDHETGEVRGLLCIDCNQGIGKFHEDAARLRAAADYLERCRR